MIDIDKYLYEKRTSISKEVDKKTKIYLDTKYWVDICDVARGVKKNKDIAKLYTDLKNGVQNNQFICPISQTIFIEVLKQSDEKSLYQTAKIIDELSKGIIIRREKERFSKELAIFLYDLLNIPLNNDDRINIWDISILCIHGFADIYMCMLSDKDNNYLQKGFIDIIEKYSFVELINLYGINNLQIYRDSNIDISFFNQNKQTYIYQNNTFNELYLSELVGGIDAYKEEINLVFKKVVNDKREIDNYSHEEDDNADIRPLIYDLFNNNRVGCSLPSLDISAMLHSKLRWNKTQKYKKGDLNDIAHATTALPYYDYFFTEKSLHNMIKECKYDEKYSCTVASKNNEILDILEKLNLS